ncbi:MAG: DapH/DapD/GlmU-related protein [Candidatus Pararuminococcus gallinarum]
MISERAHIASNAVIGENVVIEDDVVVGEGCQIGHHVVIRQGSRIGDNVRIDDFSCIGKLPMKAANSATTSEKELPPATVEDGCMIGTHVVIYRGAVMGKGCLAADQATIREDVTVGERTIIGRGVTVENFCHIGSFTKIESNAYITAYSRIGDRCFIAPCVVTSNDNFAGRTKERFSHFRGVTIENGGRVGAGSVILPGKTIGTDAFVAAGSVVTKDISPKMVAMGSPAREIRPVPEEQLLENQ